MRHRLTTRWGRDLDPDHVLQAHPRPQLVRESYLNLNGWWDYAITPADGPPAPGPSGWDGRILVPFSPEAPLSGVDRQLLPDQRLTYRRPLRLPEGFAVPGGRVLLHFGAVDQTCRVLIDGVEVGRNEGGYLPFTCDLTAALAGASAGDPTGAHELVVVVRDRSDGAQHASGKQRLARGGIWYTAQSGIWQTVWAESVPALHVERLTLVPLLTEGCVEVTVHAGPDGRPTGPVEGVGRVTGAAPVARVRVGGTQVDVPVGTPTRVPVPGARPWSPEDPHLLDVEVVLGADRVTSYVGLRSFGVGRDADGTPRLLLNGAPYQHVGVLDQGYWPDGLMTAPSDAALEHDVATMKALGFTVLRKHLKVEPLRWYHHCDRLGVLVWQDFVNGGGRYRTAAVTWPGRYPVRLRDTRWRRALGRSDPAGRAVFEEESRRTVELLRSVVSLAVWVPFNEGWGQFDAERAAAWLRRLDPTRVVDHASGWHDQGAGDVRSLHHYGATPFRVPRRADGRALVLSEYGGRPVPVAGHVLDDEVAVGYGEREGVTALQESFTRLHEHLAGTVAAGLAGTVYTQLSDVEDEVNGLVTYDREVLKVDPVRTRAALDRLRGVPPPR